MRELLDPGVGKGYAFCAQNMIADEAWRIKFRWPDGYGNSIYLRHCVEWLVKQHTVTLEENSAKWANKSASESRIRPSVAVIWWTLNEALDARQVPVPLDVNHECWKILVKFADESHKFHDRVAIVITGPSETWAMNTHLDAWFNHARMLCVSNGVPVFDFSSEVHNCLRDNGFHFKSSREQGEKYA